MSDKIDIDTKYADAIEKLMRLQDEKLKLQDQRLLEIDQGNGVGKLVQYGLLCLGSHNVTKSQISSFGTHAAKLTLRPIFAVREIKDKHRLSTLSRNRAPSFIWRSISPDRRLPSWSGE